MNWECIDWVNPLDRTSPIFEITLRDNTIPTCRIDGFDHIPIMYDSRISYHTNDNKKSLVPKIKNVIYNDPAVIVFWNDGTKTVVKSKNEPFSKEKGLAMAIAKKAYGNTGAYYDVFRKWDACE